jgi:hypothetical protein
MEPLFDFTEITFLNEDNQNSGPLREREFYEWLHNNSKDTIVAILSLKYKVDGLDYFFKVERHKLPILNKWDAICTYPKSAGQPIEFTFDWKRGLDIRIDFERRLKEELEKANDILNCVCKQQNRSNEMIAGNKAVSNF